MTDFLLEKPTFEDRLKVVQVWLAVAGVAVGAIGGWMFGFWIGGFGGAILFALFGAVLGGHLFWALPAIALIALAFSPLVLLVLIIRGLWGVGM